MATKRQTKPQAYVPPAPKCTKCGHPELITQLRKVAVDIGWKMTQIHAVAPCQMCTKCGKTTVIVNAIIGDLADLVPDPEVVARAQAAAAKAKAKPQTTKVKPQKKGKKKAVKRKR